MIKNCGNELDAALFFQHHVNHMDMEKKDGIRLNKAIAAAGYCSRRKADTLIFAGRVHINGMVEQNPARAVYLDDTIYIDGNRLEDREKFVYALLHKPVHVVSTAHDPQGRRTVLDCLPAALRKYRLYPVGRLDYFSEGLLLLTNDGALAHRLMHPSCHQSKKYEVLVRGPICDSAIQAMRAGMTLAEGEKLSPVEVTAETDNSGNTMLHLTLGQGINRQIRRMCRDLQLTILRLKRVSQGVLTLGGLLPGNTRLLDDKEVTILRQSLELR